MNSPCSAFESKWRSSPCKNKVTVHVYFLQHTEGAKQNWRSEQRAPATPEGSGHNHSVSGEAKRAAPCPQSCGTRDRWVLIAHYIALPLSPLNLAQYQKASRCWKNLSTSLFPYFRGCYLHKQKQQASNKFFVPWLEFPFLKKYKNKNHVS